MAAVKSLPVHHHSVGYILFPLGSLSPFWFFENRIPFKPALGEVCSLANYSLAYEETRSNRVSDFHDFVYSLFTKAILFDFYFSLEMVRFTIKLAYRKLTQRDITFLKIKVHEVRVLAFSCAFFDKVSLNDILKAAVWNHLCKILLEGYVSASYQFASIGPSRCCPKSGGG